MNNTKNLLKRTRPTEPRVFPRLLRPTRQNWQPSTLKYCNKKKFGWIPFAQRNLIFQDVQWMHEPKILVAFQFESRISDLLQNEHWLAINPFNYARFYLPFIAVSNFSGFACGRRKTDIRFATSQRSPREHHVYVVTRLRLWSSSSPRYKERSLTTVINCDLRSDRFDAWNARRSLHVR